MDVYYIDRSGLAEVPTNDGEVEALATIGQRWRGSASSKNLYVNHPNPPNRIEEGLAEVSKLAIVLEDSPKLERLR